MLENAGGVGHGWNHGVGTKLLKSEKRRNHEVQATIASA